MTTHGFRNKENELKIINELIGLSHGIVADGVVNKAEAEYLHKWLVANEKTVLDSPVLSTLFVRVHEILNDGVLDDSESHELLETLLQITGGDFDLTEKPKPTTLPLTMPPPKVTFEGKCFCFSGTFEYGSRKDCHKLIDSLGGSTTRSITKNLDYLVIGKFVTDDWIHSTYGRKIEKAFEYRERGEKVAIITEDYFLKSI